MRANENQTKINRNLRQSNPLKNKIFVLMITKGSRVYESVQWV